MPITTTLNRLRVHSPCATGWAKLWRHVAKDFSSDDPLPFAVILASNGLADALWCCRAAPEHDHVWRLFAVWCARRALARVQSPDPRSIVACDVAERHATGRATDEELTAAAASAYAAAYDARERSLARSAAIVRRIIPCPKLPKETP